MSHVRANRTRGFTLLEVLVGLTILGMMAALLVSSIFTLTSGARSGEARLDQIDADRLITRFLRTQVESAFAVTRIAEDERTAVFDGRPDRLEFVGHLPAHRGGGGLKILRLSVEAKADGDALMLAAHDVPRTRSNDARPADDAWEHRELVDDVESVRFSYFGSRGENDAPRWTDRWSGLDHLPALIKLELSASGRVWPPLVISIRSRSAVGQPHLLVEGA